MSVLMAEKCNSLSPVVNTCIYLFGYYVLLYFNLLSVYHCIYKGYQKYRYIIIKVIAVLFHFLGSS